MFNGIFDLIGRIVRDLIDGVLSIVSGSEQRFYNGDFLYDPVNLSLFSDNVIFRTNMYDIIVFTALTTFTIILIKFLVKATYKIIKKVFGVIKP